MTVEPATTTPLPSKPIRLRIPKLLDVVLITDPEQMKWLNQHPDITRPLDPSASWLHRFINGRLASDLAFDGAVLPVFLARTAAGRAERQKTLADRLEALRGLPGEERNQIADYVSGKNHAAEIGVTVQEWCGRLFTPRYRGARELYEAGRLIASWPSASPFRTWKDRASGRLAKAKNLLSQAAEGDAHCIHGTSIGMENVARSVRKLRKAAGSAAKQELSPDDILRECLVAPPAVLRGCQAEVAAPFLVRPLTRQSVIVFLVARAFANTGDFDVAFLSDGWSACPARPAVTEMLRSVWHAAHHDEAKESEQALLAKINSWGRSWQRVVS